ncbi:MULTISPECIES: alpha/beta hydrolase family protein [unclassified Brenneria]|uniref:alpha/beta hydrolase family protein n=1 Tax=unclassified Brenneria TaxID=2634434 RepID=UPI001553926A|nr:alpha/beta fold hydrolase [Brenneria sp. HEZEL_4_2_4]NPD00574.1 hypothetical protein [Brenneria sp. hezel4-2-4]
MEFPCAGFAECWVAACVLTKDLADRKLDVAVLYPTLSSQRATLIGDNPAFFGLSAIENAEPESGIHPLVVISHGYGGSWRNQLWLAHALVQKGYIVAAPNHPGTTTAEMDDGIAASLWLRPDDLSRVITAVQQRRDVGNVAPEHIAVVGHSLGGWTSDGFSCSFVTGSALLVRRVSFVTIRYMRIISVTMWANATMYGASSPS